MALKDWKQTRPLRWENRKIDQSIIITEQIQFVPFDKPKRTFRVLVNSIDGSTRFAINGNLNGLTFNSKSRALRSVRNYRRTH